MNNSKVKASIKIKHHKIQILWENKL